MHKKRTRWVLRRPWGHKLSEKRCERKEGKRWDLIGDMKHWGSEEGQTDMSKANIKGKKRG